MKSPKSKFTFRGVILSALFVKNRILFCAFPRPKKRQVLTLPFSYASYVFFFLRKTSAVSCERTTPAKIRMHPI